METHRMANLKCIRKRGIRGGMALEFGYMLLREGSGICGCDLIYDAQLFAGLIFIGRHSTGHKCTSGSTSEKCR